MRDFCIAEVSNQMNEEGHNVVWIKEAMNYYIPCQNQAPATIYNVLQVQLPKVSDQDARALDLILYLE